MSTVLPNLTSNDVSSLRSKWGLSLAIGIVLVIAGVVAMIDSVTATFASLFALAAIMIVAAIALAVHGFSNYKWSGFLLDLLGAATIFAAAILMLSRPVSSVLVVTMVLALWFIISGFAQTIGGFAGRYRSSGWAVAGGLISIALGVMLLASWPTSALWFLGFAVGVNLLFTGGGLIRLAMIVRNMYEDVQNVRELRRAG